MDKVLVKVYVPMLDVHYEMWIPTNKRIYNVIIMLRKAVNELSGGYYNNIKKIPLLYNKVTTEQYDVNITVKESSIRNGTELVLI